jgi:hypothetical protein
MAAAFAAELNYDDGICGNREGRANMPLWPQPTSPTV